MGKKKEMTQEKKIRIFCVKNGHANYVWKFWGYIHCGRCGDQIGDQLGSIYDTTQTIVVGHECKMCSEEKKKLSKFDKLILKKVEKAWASDNISDINYEKILKGVDIP